MSRELVILSGKGGSGKTSIAASFAVLAKDAVIADCDVDAADMHLVLDPTINKTEEFYCGNIAQIDPAKCTACGKCLKLCRFNAIITANDKFAVDKMNCEGCGVCFDNCLEKAITFDERLTGKILLSTFSGKTLVHAELDASGENSGKLVTAVRQKATQLAKDHDKELIIIDGPPGIGCPAIASLAGVWRCLIVTEPTKSGLHDLKRIIKLTKHFDVECAILVNKADINQDITNSILEYTEDEELIYLGELPFDKRITEAQRAGKTIMSYDCETSERIKEVFCLLTSKNCHHKN